MIWAPLAGEGSLNGFRYRDTLRPLAIDELMESHDEAIDLVETLAVKPHADLGDWQGHGPALSVYAQWAVYALLDRLVIDDDECSRRLHRLAALQQRNGLHPGYPGLHGGRSTGWSAPAWWGGPIHDQHRAELIRKAPDRYSQQDWFGAGGVCVL